MSSARPRCHSRGACCRWCNRPPGRPLAQGQVSDLKQSGISDSLVPPYSSQPVLKASWLVRVTTPVLVAALLTAEHMPSRLRFVLRNLVRAVFDFRKSAARQIPPNDLAVVDADES